MCLDDIFFLFLIKSWDNSEPNCVFPPFEIVFRNIPQFQTACSRPQYQRTINFSIMLENAVWVNFQILAGVVFLRKSRFCLNFL